MPPFISMNARILRKFERRYFSSGSLVFFRGMGIALEESEHLRPYGFQVKTLGETNDQVIVFGVVLSEGRT